VSQDLTLCGEHSKLANELRTDWIALLDEQPTTMNLPRRVYTIPNSIDRYSLGSDNKTLKRNAANSNDGARSLQMVVRIGRVAPAFL